MADAADYPLRPGTGALCSFWLDSTRHYAAAADLPVNTTIVLLAIVWEDLRRYVQPDGDLSRRPVGETHPPRAIVTRDVLLEALPGFEGRLESDLRHLLARGWITRQGRGFIADADAQTSSSLKAFRREKRQTIERLYQRSAPHFGLTAQYDRTLIRDRPIRLSLAWAGFAIQAAKALSLDAEDGVNPALALLAAIKVQAGVPPEAKDYHNCYRSLWRGEVAPVPWRDLGPMLHLGEAELDKALNTLRSRQMITNTSPTHILVPRDVISHPDLQSAYGRVWRAGVDLVSTSIAFGLNPRLAA